MISNPEYLENHPIYSLEIDLGSAIFCNDDANEHFDCEIVEKKEKEPKQVSSNEMELTEEKWCNMHFDGAVGKEGAGVGVYVACPAFEYKSFSFKLYFECTNNVAKYEALILGIKMIKKLEIKKVIIYGDSKSMINQVKGIYQVKHPRMRAYRNIVLDLLQDIPKYQFVVVPREQNAITDALAVSASLFKIHIHPNKKYEIEVKHRPVVPNNIKYWQVFEDDKQVESFLATSGEFKNCFIDDEILDMEDIIKHSLNQIAEKDIIQLSINSIPKGLLPLEELFDNNDVAKAQG